MPIETTTAQPRILMCPPDFYGVEYEINPWMDREREVDHALAVEQWADLRAILESIGVKIELVPPRPGLPDLVFTANAAIVFGQRCVLSRFHHEQRQGEEPHFAAILAELGFEVVTLPDERHFEGAGDALFCGETLFGGYRIRSTALGLQHVGRIISREVIPLELVDQRFYHLDTCFCPLTTDQAVWYPPAFDSYGQAVIRSSIPTLIEVTDNEADSFAANAVVVGNRVITNSGCPQLHAELKSRGFEPIATPLGEFVKAGGSAKCLTLRLDGEEATRGRRIAD
ncbi:MAG: arginine deiminase-related protein [Planctomycetota bacterium]|nr:arginine deiminase-related protein [Planctomycetota bacterium]